ncbi:HlyD family type I secretion periplasmic adaptor subunit [Sphingomonas desiccabilis]|uniref:Membrane fusion protein (MFP) family protein n=1 Tax=Sphingomonas desiccabilis TaxID=429134 RepID=A0A4Q2IYJ0_9SPHN|nr:HlyD family type I secretion periplasmic adaptor subunit [Sphingomonas desiccabilis]MBB3909684.1 HlyD family secretion protein [Sphingomonas desiccabilis]RXZ34380.1 HlyD family type I secretion periplasmic adaptor subunit [Sphingomonas desiccabilis]
MSRSLARGFRGALVPRRVAVASLGDVPGAGEASDGVGREGRIGWLLVLLFFGVFLGWAAFVRLDAAAYAGGTVAVAGNRQAVQHQQGGIVAALLVREGERVAQGQVLIELAGSETRALERSLNAQVIALQAQRARLTAQLTGTPLEPPPGFGSLQGDDRIEAERAMALQRRELSASETALTDQRIVVAQQGAQLVSRSIGIREQLRAIDAQQRLLEDELRGMRALAVKGFASENRIRALERSAAALEGEAGRLRANDAEVREQIGEKQLQSRSLTSDDRQQLTDLLRTTEFTLNDLLPKLSAAREALANTQIRAPASGQVVGLTVHTVGGVIGAGERLMEIVPERVGLVIQARIAPDDADDLFVGQQAEVRIPALHARALPAILGTIRRLSADSFEDQRTGARYYTGEVVVPGSGLATMRRYAGGREIKPGLPVEILVPLRRRTLLQYLLEPLDQSLWQSFREH